MEDTEFYGRLLGLSKPWEVAGVKLDMEKQEVVVEVRCQSQIWSGDDGQRLHLHGSEERRWRHLDTCQLRTIIQAKVPRLLDPATGKTQLAVVPWAGPRSSWTLMFESFIIRVLQGCPTLSEAMKLLGINWHQAHQVMEAAVKRGLERRTLEKIDYVGLDDKSFRRGQSCISVMSDLDGQRVLEVVEGCDTESVKGLWQRLPEAIRRQVKAAAMDFGAAYAKATREAAPQAKIVYDRFHVSQLLNKGVDQVRRAEHKELGKQGDETLKKTRYLWLKKLEKLSDEGFENFTSLVKQALRTARAWEHKELFESFWSQGDEAKGRAFFAKWHKRVMSSRLEPMKKAARTFRDHLQGLLDYFLHPVTNAMSEGFNSRIQLLKSSARGFRNFESYRVRILFFLGKLSLSPSL